MGKAKPVRLRRIIDAAAQLFSERLYHEVRMDDVAAQADVSKGTLYTYFKDKDDLYLALIRDGLDRLLARIEAGFADVQTPEAKVLAFVSESLRFFDCHFHWLELIQRAEVLGSDFGCSPLGESKAKLHALMNGIARELQETGRYAIDDPALASLALFGMTREIIRSYPRPWPDGLADWIAARFLGGLARQDSPSA